MEKNTYSMNQSAIESLYRQLINSWNEMDARAFAALFTGNGSIVGFDGSMANGREKINEHLSSIFADHSPAKFVTIIKEIRLLSDSVWLLRATVGMVPRGQHEINPKTNAIQSVVAVKEDEQFRIALFQNTPAAFHGRPELVKELTEELEEEFESHVDER
jgi:uncharacterized protein (TIGR02246 family)